MNTKIKFVMAFGLAIVFTFMLSRCKNPLDGFKTEINSNISSTSISILVTNANKNATNQTPANLTLELKGNGVSRIYEVGGGKNFTMQNGIINLILLGSDKPSSINVLNFSAILKADGFLDIEYPISIADTGSLTFQIPMVEISNPPEGVSLVSGTATLDNTGTINSDLQISTPKTQGKLENFTCKISEGTVMKDELGNPVTGNVTVELVHYDNRSFESIQNIPGGNFAANVVDKNGNKLDPVEFETAGFVNIEIHSGSQKVKTFSKPVETLMELNELTINPKTGSAIKENDSIQIWSKSEESDTWVYEGDEVITKDVITGKLVSKANISHLSFWRRSWSRPSYYYYYYWPICSNPFVRINTNVNKYVYYELVSQSGYVISTGVTYIYNGARMYFNPQSGNTARVNFYSGSAWWNKGSLITQTSLFSTCGGSTSVNLNFPAPTIVNLEISAKCPSGRIIRPSFDVYYKTTTNSWWQYMGSMINGKVTTDKFELGKTYIFGVNYGGNWYQYERIIDKNNYSEVLNLSSADFVCK